jgi:hypothetical protein
MCLDKTVWDYLNQMLAQRKRGKGIEWCGVGNGLSIYVILNAKKLLFLSTSWGRSLLLASTYQDLSKRILPMK